MFEDFKIVSRVCGAVGASVALFATFLPWYSFEVVLPVRGTPLHFFAVTSTLWGFTTLAPILVVAGAIVALALLAVGEGRLTAIVTALIALAILVYAAVRCFDLPSLGVALVGPNGVVATKAVTVLEGGPFVAIAGGLMLAIGALGNLWPASSAVPGSERETRRGWEREGPPFTPRPAP
jgi:hypothetical protein